MIGFGVNKENIQENLLTSFFCQNMIPSNKGEEGKEWWGGIESPIVNLLSEIPSTLNYKTSRMTGRV